MKIKTSELTGPALDWAVWKCTGGAAAYPKTASGAAFLKLWKGNSAKYIHPSTDWAQGGPTKERHKINTGYNDAGQPVAWIGHVSDYDVVPMFYGPTELIAAMRCYVASRLGDEVDVPEELS